jgi:hypothetical protein
LLQRFEIAVRLIEIQIRCPPVGIVAAVCVVNETAVTLAVTPRQGQVRNFAWQKSLSADFPRSLTGMVANLHRD